MGMLVSTGRGGVGKTSFIALALKYLRNGRSASSGKRILAVDADPDQSLAMMLGVDLEKEGVRTVSEIIFDVKDGTVDESVGKAIPARPDQIEFLFHQGGLYEGPGFDFFALGAKWTAGCYCLPNHWLKALMEKISPHYDFTLIDSPAGLEHLNRRITTQVEGIFAILDGTKKSFNNISTSKKLIGAIGIHTENFYIVGNHIFPEDREPDGELLPEGTKFLGSISRDEEVARRSVEGESLLDLSDNSPAYLSVIEVLKKAGY
jgi:CO dehydrogenase maturation factor